MQITDTVALITGGKRIGAVVAVELARRGSDIALSYHRSEQDASDVAQSVQAIGRRATTKQGDLGSPAACEALVQHTVETLGRIDVLINMTSHYVRTPYDDLGADHLARNLDIDLASAFHCARAAVPHMRTQGAGRIINFSDWLAASGRPRYPGYLTYYVAKAGVIALTEALALELAGDDILVNAIAPGPIVPPPDTSPDDAAAVERATPVGRWGGELEIAKAVIALIETDFITGQTIRVDGGRHLK